MAIDLDQTNPLPQKRITGKLEVTRSSYSQGLGVDREPGFNMARDDLAFRDLKKADSQKWLRDLRDAAQEALFPELQKVGV